MRDGFLNRGYTLKIMEDAHKGALSRRRTDLLRPREKNNEDVLRLLGTYDDHAHEVRKILDKYWGILKADKGISEFLPRHPGITFRKGRSLKHHLVHSHYEA